MKGSLSMAALALLTVTLAGQGAPAEEMRVDPGKWEFRMTSKHAMGAPTRHVETTCIDERGMTPERFMDDMDGCQVRDIKTDKSTMSWSMACENQGGKVTGDGKITTTGTTLQGAMNMQMEMGGMKMAMEQTWEGKRLGSCEN